MSNTSTSKQPRDPILMAVLQFCDKIKAKKQVFYCAGHGHPYSSNKNAVYWFLFCHLKGTTNFCAYWRKAFERSYGYALHAFHQHSSKICLVQNGEQP